MREGVALAGRVWRSKHILPIAILLLLPLVARWPATSGWLDLRPISRQSGFVTSKQDGLLPGIPSSDPNDGITTEALGKFAANEWLHGRVPWWNPYGGVGLPLAAEGQNPALFLPFVLLLNWKYGLLALLIVLQLIAGLSTYALLGQLGLCRWSALAGAGLFELNGTMCWFSHGPAMPVAFLPMLVLGTERARASAIAQRRGGWAWAALGLAGSLYAGFPETAYLQGLGAGCIALFRISQLGLAQGRRLFGKLAVAAITGLLLAAPYLVAFLYLLGAGTSGGHDGDLSAIHLPPEGFSSFINPYLLGPILAYTWRADPSLYYYYHAGPLFGGFVGSGTVVLAAFATFGGSQRPLRLALLAIATLFLAITMGAPGSAELLRIVPLLSQVEFPRYAPPVWELCLTVLAAFAVDDWLRLPSGGLQGRVWVACFALAALFGTALLAKRQIELQWAQFPDYRYWAIGSLGSAVLIVLLLVGLTMRPATPMRAASLIGAVLLEASLLFSVPSLSGVRHPKFDDSTLAFLRDHVGLARYYSIGQISPNYSAYFAVASVNFDYMPAPRDWVAYVQQLLTHSNPLALSGAPAALGDDEMQNVQDFLDHEAGYANAAVRFVVTRDSVRQLSPHRAQTPIQRKLPGDPLQIGTVPYSFEFRLPQGATGLVGGVAVTVATYLAHPTGTLALELCSDTACRTGRANILEAQDNTSLSISLDAPLQVTAGQLVRVTFRRLGGDGPFAVWLYPVTAGLEGKLPELQLVYSPPDALPLVHRSGFMNVFELTSAKPYWEVRDGDCVVEPASREQVTLECRTPARLLRRELFFPVWSANVNGVAASVSREDGVYQSVTVPMGRSTVHFTYRPPGLSASLAASALGAALLLWPVLSRRKRGGSEQSRLS